ncbi:MAG: hypothetical protein JWP49_1817 [Phenylobacterium sp.]|nr:hypothetical protein [Phenylobacterium sp.]
MFQKTLAALALGAGMTLAAASGAAAQDTPKNDYSKDITWLCRPGKTDGDACGYDLTTTVIQANGKSSLEAFHRNPKAPIDCFYVYPTVSNDPGVLSDMVPGPEEVNVVKVQLARFGSKCRIFAPLYRQFTLTALRAASAGRPMGGGARPQTGYNDVVDAWNYYLAHDNHGRGVVLIGHSQGSGVLTQLIKNEIDGKPVQKKIVSAILMGTTLPVQAGKDTGAFKGLPLCHAASQTGCVIAYASFRDTIPPPDNSRFGKVRGANAEGMQAACVNPANLTGGKGALHSYLSNVQIANSAAAQKEWVKGQAKPETPFVSTPGLLSAQCVNKNGFSYLEIHVNADASDPRADDIVGDVIAGGVLQKDWGLHLIDANLAMGNLVDVVGAESKAYLAKAKK